MAEADEPGPDPVAAAAVVSCDELERLVEDLKARREADARSLNELAATKQGAEGRISELAAEVERLSRAEIDVAELRESLRALERKSSRSTNLQSELQKLRGEVYHLLEQHFARPRPAQDASLVLDYLASSAPQVDKSRLIELVTKTNATVIAAMSPTTDGAISDGPVRGGIGAIDAADVRPVVVEQDAASVRPAVTPSVEQD